MNPLGAPISPFSSLDPFFLFFLSLSFLSFFDLEGVIWFWLLLSTSGDMEEEVGVPESVTEDAIILFIYLFLICVHFMPFYITEHIELNLYCFQNIQCL